MAVLIAKYRYIRKHNVKFSMQEKITSASERCTIWKTLFLCSVFRLYELNQGLSESVLNKVVGSSLDGQKLIPLPEASVKSKILQKSTEWTAIWAQKNNENEGGSFFIINAFKKTKL